MNQKAVIQKTANFVKEVLSDSESGHDWWHIYRVWNLSKYIAQAENVDNFTVELGALLHDIADPKFHNGDEKIGPRKAKRFLNSLNVDEKVVTHIENIIFNISFRGSKYIQKFKSPELNVVQDADRLDAMGAIGIARAFVFAGYKKLKIYDPNISPNPNINAKEYKNYKRENYTQINHFYEKLLLLKNKMNTETGKSIAKHRHKYMEQFLDEFYKEWDGKL